MSRNKQDPPETDKKPESIIARIIEAASILFEKQGLYETSVAEIAEVAGLSVPETYHYVKRKAEILLLIMEDFTTKFKDRVQPEIQALTDPKIRLARAMEVFFNLVDEHLIKAVLIYRMSRSLEPEGRARIKAAELEHLHIFEKIIKDGLERGEFKTEDANLAAYNIIMAGHAWALKKWHWAKRWTLDEYTRLQINMTLKALS
ncbi:MAG: TetR/AcrR family transcriptional regulator [Thermodesulfobacteriota bacterium]